MKFIQFIIIISMLFTTAAIADTVPVLETPAGIYDALHAKLAVDHDTGRAYVKVILMDESAYKECWGNQAAMQGIGADNCRVSIQRLAVPGLSYNADQNAITFQGSKVDNDAVIFGIHYKDIDDGVSINAIKHVSVQLEKPL